jgi:hypothetical protein
LHILFSEGNAITVKMPADHIPVVNHILFVVGNVEDMASAAVTFCEG